MELIPSSGVSIESILRGVLGVCVLLLLAYSISINKKAIKWKTVSLGLMAQFIIAICVLKISWITTTFEYFGSFFIKILNYTQAGTEMLFGDFSNIEKCKLDLDFQLGKKK